MPLFSRKVGDPTIAGLEKKQDVAGLMEVLNHERSAVRRAKAATALGVIGDREAARALDLARHDRDKDVREAADAALERIASAPVKQNRDVKALIKALNHKEHAVRRDAAETLGEIGDERAIMPLVGTVLASVVIRNFAHGAPSDLGLSQDDKEKDQVRRAAGLALSKIGPHAVSPLVEALDAAYDSFKVRGVYKEAIASIKKRWARDPRLLLVATAAFTLGELEWEPATERLSRLREQLAGPAETARQQELRLIARNQIPGGSLAGDLSVAHRNVTYALQQIRDGQTARRDVAIQRLTAKLQAFIADPQPSAGDAVQILTELYDSSPYQGGGFVKLEPPAEPVRQVGQQLYEAGGHEAMLEIHVLFAAQRPQMARNLEMVWDGIGTWGG